MSPEKLRQVIEEAYERRAELTPQSIPPALGAALAECITLLDAGRVRVAEKRDGHWVVNQWLKKAVLLAFRARENEVVDAGYTRF
jgi:2,3,4,5-tetrahydropyridine-2-carboxylate N-succinyltransferase